MVLNIGNNPTEPTAIGRFGLEKKDPTLGISLPEGLIDDYFKNVQSSPDGSYPELPIETSAEEAMRLQEEGFNQPDPSTTSQTEKLFPSKKPKLRPPSPPIKPKIRPGSVSPIDKIAELNYLLEGSLDPKSKKSQIISNLSSLTENGQRAVKGFFDNAAGGESGLDPAVDYWCAAFVTHVLSELGADPLNPKSKPGSTERYDRLRADKYRNYGSEVKGLEDAREGDIIVFDMRNNDGIGDHVAFYAGGRITSQGGIDPLTGKKYINVVGGNQGAFNEVSIRENQPGYTMDNVVAIRRITYNDIDFEFTQKMAEENPVFKQFIPDPEYALNLVKDAETPSFDKGGLTENKDLDLARSYGVTVVDPEETSQTVKALGKAAIESIPGISTATTIRDIKEELQEEDPSLAKIGMLAASEAVGMIPGLGQVGKTIIRKTSTKLVDKAADAKEAERLIKDSEALEAWQKKEGGKGKRQENPDDSEAAAEALYRGDITSKEARKRVGKAIPPPKEYTADEVRNMMPTVTDVTGAMGKKAQDYGILGVKGFKLKKGQLLGTRLDIPAYNKYDKWVVSIHDGGTKEKINLKGSVLGYGQAIRLKNVRFGSQSKEALDIARGKILVKKTGKEKPFGKSTIARAVGEYVPEDPYKLQEMAASIIESGSKEWTQVGMNPYRGSQFYDKKTGKIIFDAEEMIQVGPLVLAKNAKVATISDLKEMAVRTKDGKLRMFNEGGIAMDDQMKMAFMDEGGIADDGMDVDPVSGNEVPPGSLAEEVRDDIPAQLSEGEYVVPADVVRYYGVKFFEDLRDQAKMGLADMEANGRIGGEPVPAGGPINDSELSPQEMQAIQEMMGTNMNEGGQVQNPYLQQQQLYSQPRPAPIDEKRNTTLTNINPNPVESQMPMQSMASGGQVQGYQPGGPVTPAQDQMMYAQNTFDPFNYGAGYSFMGPTTGTGTPGAGTSLAPTITPVADTPAIPESMTLYGPNGEIRTFSLPLSEADAAEVARLKDMGYSETKSVTPVSVSTGGDGGNKVSKPDPNAWMEKFDYRDMKKLASQTSDLLSKPTMSGPIGAFINGQHAAQAAANIIILEASGQNVNSLKADWKKFVDDDIVLRNLSEEMINGDQFAKDIVKNNIDVALFKDSTDIFGNSIFKTDKDWNNFMDDVSPPGMKFDPNKGSYTRQGSAAPTSSPRPRPRPRPRPQPPTTSSSSGSGSSGSSGSSGGSGMSFGNTPVSSNTSNTVSTAQDKIAAAAEENPNENIYTGGGPGGGFEKGGLMASPKKNKKRQPKKSGLADKKGKKK